MLDDDDALGVDAEALALIAGPARVAQPKSQSSSIPPLAPSVHKPTSFTPQQQSAAVPPSSPLKKDIRTPPTTDPPHTSKRQRTIQESFGVGEKPAAPQADVTTRELSQRLSPAKKDLSCPYDDNTSLR